MTRLNSASSSFERTNDPWCDIPPFATKPIKSSNPFTNIEIMGTPPFSVEQTKSSQMKLPDSVDSSRIFHLSVGSNYALNICHPSTEEQANTPKTTSPKLSDNDSVIRRQIQAKYEQNKNSHSAKTAHLPKQKTPPKNMPFQLKTDRFTLGYSAYQKPTHSHSAPIETKYYHDDNLMFAMEKQNSPITPEDKKYQQEWHNSFRKSSIRKRQSHSNMNPNERKERGYQPQLETDVTLR